jgi:hypothetical protein
VPTGASTHDHRARAADVGSRSAPLLTKWKQAPLLTSIMSRNSRRRGPADTSTHEHHEQEQQKWSASNRCRVPGGASTYEHHVREQQTESACGDLRLLTSLMCKSSRRRGQAGISTHAEQHEGEQ